MLRCDDLMNGYHIWQDTDLFCFGIDAVLLAHYPALRRGDRIMDLGTGFGPIPLILRAEAEKKGLIPGIRITGLELQHAAASLADQSVRENGLSEEIEIREGDIREAEALFGPASFSLITCNPPYMAAKEGLISENEGRAIARTEICCTLEDVIRVSSRLLKMSGRLALIHRPHRLPEIFGLMRAGTFHGPHRSGTRGKAVPYGRSAAGGLHKGPDLYRGDIQNIWMEPCFWWQHRSEILRI